MKLFTLSKSGVPLLDGEPIDGLLGFRLTQAAADEPPVLETNKGPVPAVIDDIEVAEDAKA